MQKRVGMSQTREDIMRQSGPSHKIFSFNNLGFLACLVAMALILAGGTAAARIPYLTNEEQIAVLTLHEVGDAVAGYKLAHGSYPEPVSQLIPVMDLGLALNADGDGYPHLDPWGSPSFTGAMAWTTPW